MLGSKSLEQLANHEQKLVQIQISESISLIRQYPRCYKSEHKNIQAAKRRIQNMPGLTDRNTGPQNFN